MRKRSCHKKIGIGHVKMLGFHGNHSGFENGVMPTKVLISQLLFILDY